MIIFLSSNIPSINNTTLGTMSNVSKIFRVSKEWGGVIGGRTSPAEMLILMVLKWHFRERIITNFRLSRLKSYESSPHKNLSCKWGGQGWTLQKRFSCSECSKLSTWSVNIVNAIERKNRLFFFTIKSAPVIAKTLPPRDPMIDVLSTDLMHSIHQTTCWRKTGLHSWQHSCWWLVLGAGGWTPVVLRTRRTVDVFLFTLTTGLDHAEGASTGFMVASYSVLTDGYGHGGSGVCLGDGQTKASLRDMGMAGLASAWAAWRALRLSGRWPDRGRRSTFGRWTRRRAAPACAPISDLTCSPYVHPVTRNSSTAYNVLN